MAECYTDVYIARYEVYPNVDPTGYCVGFRAKCSPNELSGYWDTVVPNADIPSGSTDTDICALAWDGYGDPVSGGLGATITTWADAEMVKTPLIGELYKKLEEPAE
jgi:hypothetical protein